ncbi:hypothetical protein MMPV_004137 [Pyropia vietnamensis]
MTQTMIMTTLDHPNVVKMYQAMTTISKVVIVMELVTGGELYHEILRHKRLTEESARYYYKQLIEGLHHCHSHGVYHRDLKPENLLLDHNGCLKISDFGLSTLQLKHEDRCHTQCGTPNYVAPEVISRAVQGYDGAKVDVWSSGIVLYVLVAGELPFDDNDPTELFRKIVAGVFELPHWFSEPLRDLIPHLLDLEPESRYGLEQIRSHPWYTQLSPPAPPPLPIPAALPVTSSTIAAAAAETSASCASVAVATPRDREEEDALFPGMNFINPTFKPTDTPGNVHPDVKLSIGQQSDLSAFGAPPVAPADAGACLPVVASRPDAVLRSGAVPPLPPTTARRPRSRQSSYLSRFQSAEHLSDSGMNTTRPDAVPDVAHSDGEASMVEEQVTGYIAPGPRPPPPRLVTEAAAVRHAPTAVRAAAPSSVANGGAPIGAASRSERQDNIDRVAAELMAANDSAPLNEVPSALNAERMRRYLIQQQEQVLQQHHSSTDADRSPLAGAAPALSAEGIRQLAVAREAAAVAVAASVVAAPSPSAHVPTPFVAAQVDTGELPYVPQVLPATGSGVAELAFGVPPLPLAAVDPAVVAALDAERAQDLDDVASSRANQFDDAPADSGELGDALADDSHGTIPEAPVLPPSTATPAPSPHVLTNPPAVAAAVEHVDPDRGALSPAGGGAAALAAPAMYPAAWSSPPLSSPLVDLTAAVSCNICVGCVQGEVCLAPVDVNAEVYNRGLDSMWQKLVDACEADAVNGGVPAARADEESDVTKQVEHRATGRVVRPPSAGSQSSSRARRLQSGDSSVGQRGVSSPMTSGGNVESQLVITRDHQLLKHIGRPWRAVGPGRPDKRSDELRISPGPPKPLFPPALVDDGELVVIAGDEPCLTPASPDALVSIGSAVGSDGHASRHVHSRTGGSLSDEDGVHIAAQTGASRGNRSGGGQRDGVQESSRSLPRSESSSRDERNPDHSSRGHSPVSHSRYDRDRISLERSGPQYMAQRPSVPNGHRSSRSSRHERRPSGYRGLSPHGDTLALSSSRRNEIRSEESSRSPQSRSDAAPRSPKARDDREGHASREWVADSSSSRGPGAAVGDTPKPLPAAVDEAVGRPTAVAGSLEGSTVTSVTGSSSVGVVEVSRLGGFKGVTSRLLAKAPLQLGPGRARRDTEFNSLLSPRATMEKLVLVLRHIPAVQSADAVEASTDAYQVNVRSLVPAPGRGGSDLLRVTVMVFRREPGGLTVASFRRSKGRQDGDDFKAWYAIAYDSFCSWDERSAELRARGGAVRAGGPV